VQASVVKDASAPVFKVKDPVAAPCFHKGESAPEIAAPKKGFPRNRTPMAAMNSDGGNSSSGNNNRALIKAI